MARDLETAGPHDSTPLPPPLPGWRRPGVQLAMLSIRAYQATLSKLIPPICRFYPSCSHYGLEAYRQWGLVRGTVLTLSRVLRCNPFCKGGFDPVPEKPPKAAKASPGTLSGASTRGKSPSL